MDLYIVLGVRQDATESDIKRAYRRLARRFHPDINPGDRTAEERFRQVLDAYEILIDQERRSRYDAGHEPQPPGEARRNGFEGFDFSARGVDHSATFGDLFAEVLMDRGTRASSAERGADLHQEVRLTFEQAFSGHELACVVTRRDACRACAGAGVATGATGACSMCQGTGAVRSVRGHMVFSRTCSGCGGSGRHRPRACTACAGAGHDVRSETVTLRVPPGVTDGERLRVSGAGDAGLRGGPAGDLYMTVRVAPHERFRREGDDIHVVVPVAIHEAGLGARVDVAAPDGVARVRVPPGTQSGQRFRLRERGAPSTRTGLRGDLVVEVRLELPPLLDERSKELLREFGRINERSARDRTVPVPAPAAGQLDGTGE
jgi:molecular chaperone DnaJ